MATSFHIGQSVRGALKHRSSLRELAGNITVDGVTLATPEAVQEFLMDQLAEGHEVIPYGDCDNWDWKTGCKGHPKD